jgi:hypothetical protein
VKLSRAPAIRRSCPLSGDGGQRRHAGRLNSFAEAAARRCAPTKRSRNAIADGMLAQIKAGAHTNLSFVIVD